MREMTKANLESAFAGESMAHMKYQIFADKAEKEGYPNVAKLFKATSYAERVHANNHLSALGKVKNSPENLQVAIDGENFEVKEMYRAYKAVAELQKEKMAVRSMRYALEAERIHASMYQEAKNTIEKGVDIKISDIHVCEVCGHTVLGDAPERCPICKAPNNKFRKF